MSTPTFQRDQLRSLRSQLSAPSLHSRSRLSFPLPAMKGLFSNTGLPEGSLVELLNSQQGGGACQLALFVARELQQQQFILVLIDHFQEFYPPGAAQLGIDLDRLIVVTPHSLQEQLWTIEQSLRSPGQVVVLSPLGRIPANTYRRLKLAAEKGRNIGLFLREASLRALSSWADTRFLVEPHPAVSRSRRYKVTALTSLDGTDSQHPVILELCDESGALSVVPQLAGAETSTQLTWAS